MRGDPVRVRIGDRLRRRASPGTEEPCRAPSASLYLDQRGDVRACCQNAGFALGNVQTDSLRAIWDGERSRRLRAAVADGDLSLGCSFCAWQVADGTDEAVFARTFDHLRPASATPDWPQQLELSLSNACNLQCVMCNGEWSSAIRSHREQLPPLPVVYDDDFFEELALFLPHLDVVKFLGGEPFLGRESLRVLEMLSQVAPDVQVHITTNGTQWSPRIERILGRLRVHVVVSLDGVRQDTYESIRIGSNLDVVLANVERFLEHTTANGTSFSLSHCLMTLNWHEFDEFLLFAQARGADVYINTVTEPYWCSLYHLRPDHLARVVSDLGSRSASMRERLSGSRLRAWDDQLARLGRHAESLRTLRPPEYVAKRREQGFAWLAPPETAQRAGDELDRSVPCPPGWRLDLDRDGRLAEVRGGGASEALDAWVGAELEVGQPLPPPLCERDSAPLDEPAGDLRRRDVRLGAPDTLVQVLTCAVRGDDGVLDGVRMALIESSSTTSDVESDARVAARDLAQAHGPADGFVVGPDGCISSFLVRPDTMFGVDLSQLVGRPAAELSTALADAVGRPVGSVVEAAAPGGLHHYVVQVERRDGSVVELHSYTERVDEVTHVWVAAAADGSAVG